MTLILKRPAGAGLTLKRPVGARLELTPTNLLPDDPDAIAHIAAVEAVDGQALEPATKLALNAFVKGCKVDGTWPALKACCIMAGARTLAGALVPLVGPAPTNFNFVAGDYDRKTGLKGDGTSKYLNSNRNNNADPRNNKHLAVYISSVATKASLLIGGRLDGDDTGSSQIVTALPASNFRINTSSIREILGHLQLGFCGASRTGSTATNARYNGGLSSFWADSSQAPISAATLIFTRQGGPLTDARLSYYSIGESLDLALLDARVSALMAALAVAIP